MPCTKCSSDFNLLNWKIKCGECDDKFCSKCLKKREGVLYCEKCMILLKRPPDRSGLMQLKSKDLQAYLNKNNISTHGLVEKRELVDLLCNKHIPEKQKKGVEKFTANFAGATQINEFLDSVLPNSNSNQQRPARPRRPVNSGSNSPKTHAPPPPHTTPPTNPQTTPYQNFQPNPTPPRPSNHPPNSPNHPPDLPNRPPDPPPESAPPTAPPADQEEPTSSEDTAQTSEQTSKEQTSEPSPSTSKFIKLSDFSSEEELNCLSPKQLKQLLTLNRVDYKGCIEKNELLERARRLWIDNHIHQKDLPENIQDLCKLCMDGPLDCVLLECGHIATCIECGKKLAECPICRQYVIRVVRIFKA